MIKVLKLKSNEKTLTFLEKPNKVNTVYLLSTNVINTEKMTTESKEN